MPLFKGKCPATPKSTFECQKRQAKEFFASSTKLLKLYKYLQQTKHSITYIYTTSSFSLLGKNNSENFECPGKFSSRHLHSIENIF